jgi:hypothetical protein
LSTRILKLAALLPRPTVWQLLVSDPEMVVPPPLHELVPPALGS